jgi:hypothetical protein
VFRGGANRVTGTGTGVVAEERPFFPPHRAKPRAYPAGASDVCGVMDGDDLSRAATPVRRFALDMVFECRSVENPATTVAKSFGQSPNNLEVSPLALSRVPIKSTTFPWPFAMYHTEWVIFTRMPDGSWSR